MLRHSNTFSELGLPALCSSYRVLSLVKSPFWSEFPLGGHQSRLIYSYSRSSCGLFFILNFQRFIVDAQTKQNEELCAGTAEQLFGSTCRLQMQGCSCRHGPKSLGEFCAVHQGLASVQVSGHMFGDAGAAVVSLKVLHAKGVGS